MKKGVFVSILSVILAIFLMGAVSATLITPASSSTISGTVVLNATNSDLPAMDNCTFYAKSSSTANSSWNKLAVILNVSNEASLNTTFNSNSLQDSNDYIFNATCMNITKSITSLLNTGITIDNTIPQAPSLSPASTTILTGVTTQTFTGTVTDSNTTGCTYAIGRGGTSGSSSDTSSGSATYSTTSCTFDKTFSTSSDNGLWTWYITASDGTNSSTSQNTINVQLPASSGGLPSKVKVVDGQIVQDKAFPIWIVIIGGIIALIVLIYFLSKRK